MSSSSAGKRNREQAKRAKAEAKRQRRQAAGTVAEGDETRPGGSDSDGAKPAMSTDELLRRLEEVHRLHEDGQMTDDDFQETKADLLGQLQVD